MNVNIVKPKLPEHFFDARFGILGNGQCTESELEIHMELTESSQEYIRETARLLHEQIAKSSQIKLVYSYTREAFLTAYFLRAALLKHRKTVLADKCLSLKCKADEFKPSVVRNEMGKKSPADVFFIFITSTSEVIHYFKSSKHVEELTIKYCQFFSKEFDVDGHEA